MSANVLTALLYKTDSEGYISINGPVKQSLATQLNTSPQVIVNQVKFLSDVNLLIKKARGVYYYPIIHPADCRKIMDNSYRKLSLECIFHAKQFLPETKIIVE